jgi:hypothetical protein
MVVGQFLAHPVAGEGYLHHLTHMKWQNQVKYCSGIVAFFRLPKLAFHIVNLSRSVCPSMARNI